MCKPQFSLSPGSTYEHRRWLRRGGGRGGGLSPFRAVQYNLFPINRPKTHYATCFALPPERQVFVVSDEEDEESDEVIDYKIGTPRRHRLLPAIREVGRFFLRSVWITVKVVINGRRWVEGGEIYLSIPFGHYSRYSLLVFSTCIWARFTILNYLNRFQLR